VVEFDSDFRRRFSDRLLNFLGCLGQPVGVDVDSNAAPRAAHMLACLEPPNCLFQLMPALGTLEPDHAQIDVWHRQDGSGLKHYCARQIKSPLAAFPSCSIDVRRGLHIVIFMFVQETGYLSLQGACLPQVFHGTGAVEVLLSQLLGESIPL
jgi:hypothetical protein